MGEAATSFHCANFSALPKPITVRVTDFDGTAYEASTIMQAGHTNTFSTHGTALFFDDFILAGGGGTPAIDQGSGLVFSNSSDILCTVVVLDPQNSPPTFMERLPLHEFAPPPTDIFADGFESGDTSAWSTTVD